MKRNVIQLWLEAVLLVFFVFTACSKSSDGYSNGNNSSSNNNSSSTSNSVSIGSSRFSPSSITIKVGATVTWTNNDNTVHTVTADDGGFDSGDMDYYKTYSHTFSKAGTFPYHCVHHESMKGSVVVNP